MNIHTKVATNNGSFADKHNDLWLKQIEILKSKFELIVQMPANYPTDVPILYIPKSQILTLLEELKSGSQFQYDFLSDITATDEGGLDRFEVIYQLYSYQTGARIRIKVKLKEDESTPTAISIWPGANWAEREIWDMFGIKFDGHPNLKRLLMDNRWVGHPLRKDYPLRGYQFFPNPQEIDSESLE
jgi:NADH/F420H2 dehydrogenase subunit C